MLQRLNVSTNLPVEFRNKRDAVVFSPFFDHWNMKTDRGGSQNYYSLALPVSFAHAPLKKGFGFMLTGIVRMNDSSISKKTRVQLGGAAILSYKSRDNLTWKLGCYVNNELFGVFVMPLAGIDWRIDERNALFGVLPGSLTYEHKINTQFYYGGTFRAITNSYGTGKGYWRVDENQLGIYGDAYLGKHFVVNLELGHSLFRKLRTGEKHVSKQDLGVRDNLYGRVSIAYRIRFSR
ncbi:MAG: hypothetical protein IPP31_13030 [Chitinophagaceae bacterium]|nr:hypothetical protein [Chitinophagaceae bacterium]